MVTETLKREQVCLDTKFCTDYTAQEIADLVKLYDENSTLLKEYEVVKGVVMAVSKRDVIVNVGFKSDGLIPLNEFRDMSDLNQGDEVEVYVEALEDKKGQLVLSRTKAKLVRGWEKIQEAADNLTPIEGMVKRRTKGGLILDINGVEAFLPGSQVDYKPVVDFDSYLNKAIDVAVIKINHANNNVVVSHKALIEKGLESQKVSIISNLEKGQVLEGIAKNMASFGVFVDLGGIDGLLHVTDISWKRVSHPEEVIELGQKIKVVVLDFDEEKKRVSLGMKQLLPHPWDTLPESLQEGSKVKTKIVNISDYGIFVELVPGVEGLIHASEMSWSQSQCNPRTMFKVGDEVEAVIVTMNRDEKKMSLGIKQLTIDPWEKEDLLQKYAPGTKHKGVVKNMTGFGAFLELEPGVDALLHVSDLSWSRKVNHPSEVLKVGEELEVVILEIEKEGRKMYLGLKQLEENPWEAYQDLFQVGTLHKGTIVRSTGKGALVTLEHDMSGFALKKDLIKQDGKEAQVGEELEFKVIEFDKATRSISLSHTAAFTVPTDANSSDKPKSQAKGATPSGDFITSGKSTLGDIKALSDLKNKGDDSKKSTK